MFVMSRRTQVVWLLQLEIEEKEINNMLYVIEIS